MDIGFVQGKSDNLPRIDSTMMTMYFKKNSDFMMAEIRGIKAQRSAKVSYGDTAIGYVRVKRDEDMCTVKGRITPEHRVRKKAYSVVLVCNESEDVILSVKCAGYNN
ncbi:hypothetical protein AVEN_74722-1 [Araneus ventricosus]|uniref:Uncharacterized protein n=1 Tax=Araneus ventricosus TaxID=182803 RepID=A0A4Y2WCP8_ARAVE|nr:hypothetical protein AVEN_74722-1 [Araneus ventricosus]